MSVITIHVPPSNLAAIRCPFCGKVQDAALSRFRNTKHELSAKCSCGRIFTVKLNFRKHYRKPVTLVGEFMNLSNTARAWTPVRISDLSLGGLRLKMEFLTKVKSGDTIRVRFKLDGRNVAVVDKEVKIRYVNGEYLGGEFLNLALEEKALGFYLLAI